jgi:acetyl esterase/lipase
MKILLSLLFLVAAASAQTPHVTPPPVGFSRVVTLWPNGAPGAHGTADGDVPKLYVYPAKANPTGTAVIVMPGGGYTALVTEKEGGVEARWLSEHGVTAFVLQYRLGPEYEFPAPMLDGARAVRWVRSQAASLGINPGKVGVWGFSAGGHLAGYMASIHDGGNASAQDPIDRLGDRPDFAILSYGRLSMDKGFTPEPVMPGLLGAHATQMQIDAISPVLHVTKDNSPSFIYSTTADQKVNSRNATAFYDVLQQTGIPVELHIFELGVHGTGMGQGIKDAAEVSVFPILLQHWMQLHGWMGE